jgi:hypothetical protein
MPLHPTDSGSDPIRPVGGIKVTDLGSDHRLVRDGVEQLAHGALVCPGCSLPVRIDGPMSAGSELDCGYCETVAPAHRFLLRDVYDTPENEVFLIARIESPN